VSQSNPLDRRDFLLRAAKAGAAIVAAGGAGLWLHDRKGPSANIVSETVSLPDFSRRWAASNGSSNPATAWF